MAIFLDRGWVWVHYAITFPCVGWMYIGLLQFTTCQNGLFKEVNRHFYDIHNFCLPLLESHYLFYSSWGKEKKNRGNPKITLEEMVWEFLIIGDSENVYCSLFGSGKWFWTSHLVLHSKIGKNTWKCLIICDFEWFSANLLTILT